MENNIKLVKLIILLISIALSFSQYTNENYAFDNLNNNNYIQSINDEIEIKINEFISGYFNKSINYYKFNILNETEQIYFDYQSEFGCLNITINNTFIKTFCSEGFDNIFILKKNDIIKQIGYKEDDSIENLTLSIEVGNSLLEEEKEYFNFNYSLKVSLRKSDINIFEVNSDHKILCTTEKINDNNYRCLFMIINNNNEDKNKTLIIYSNSKSNFIKLNINADYINKDEYDNWEVNALSKNIPNINSNFTNYNKEMDFIIIPNLDTDKYIYISIESNKDITLQMFNKIIDDGEYGFPNINNIKVYSINRKDIIFNISELQEKEISLSLVTLYGKGNIYLEYEKTTEYVIDTINNKLIFDINLDKCNNNCKLKVDKLDVGDEKELGYIFYIYYTKKTDILKQLEYGKSSKLLYNINQAPLILYEQIQNIISPININLQLYNFNEINLINNFDIEVRILSKTDIYKLKLDYESISQYEIYEKSKFDSILSILIYLPKIISNNLNTNIDKLIVGTTISQSNSLMYSSENIYHYGQLNKEEKIVYRLKGNNKYHLMRLEFGCNNINIGWSVKRTNNETSYMKNDTDLSFVTEKWSNGRELLTMYIERGEDIYLTIFRKGKIENINITNYIFKYINSDKNTDFKNYIIKYDSLNFDEKNNKVTINKLANIPDSLNIKYYLKLINENDYIKNEIINTIAIIESNSTIFTYETEKNGKIVFNINNSIELDTYYHINAYSIVSNNNDDFEYISYSNSKIYKATRKIQPSSFKIIIASISISGSALIILFIRCLVYCARKRRRRLIDELNRINFIENYHYEDDYILD